MESHIVQLDFSAAFNRVSHSGLFFKLKSTGVGRSVLSICIQSSSPNVGRESWLMVQQVSESQKLEVWPQGNVLGPLLFILYSKMFH